MNEKEINEIVNEHYGFTIEEIDEDLGKALLRVKQLEYNNEKLRQENQQLKEVNSYSKRKLYNINKDRLDANLRLVKENKELHNKINKLEDKITQMHKRFINELCIDNYLGGRKTKILFEEMFEILKDSDVDEKTI